MMACDGMMTLLIIFSLFLVINASLTQNDIRKAMELTAKGHKIDKDSKSLAQDVSAGSLIKHLQLRGVNDTSSCSCKGYQCGCCLHLKWDVINLDDTVCIEFIYLPKPDYGISLLLLVDKKTIINETISARNPPPVCVDIPELKKLASLCVRFEDVEVKDETFSACVFLEGRLFYMAVEKIKLGCFSIPPKDSKRAQLEIKSLLNDGLVSKIDKIIEKNGGAHSKKNKVDGYVW